MGATKNAVAKKKTEKEDIKLKDESAFAWKIQADAILKVSELSKENANRIEDLGNFASAINNLRKRNHQLLFSEIIDLKEKVATQDWTIKNTIFWLTVLAISVAWINLALLNLVVNH